MRKIIIWIIVLLLLLQQVLAVGLSPAEKSLQYNPGFQNDLTYYVVNNEHKDLDVAIDVSGQLANFVKISTKTIHVTASEELHPFIVSINVPPTLSPGDNFAKIGMSEIVAQGNTGLMAKVHVTSKLTVKVPYPNGTSVETPLAVTPIPATSSEPLKLISFQKYFLQDQINEFSIDIQNTQNYTLSPVLASITIGGVGTIKSPPYSIEPNQETSIISFWDTKNVSKGRYTAFLSVSYQNIIINKTGTIYIVNATEYEQITGTPVSKINAPLAPALTAYLPYLILIIGLLIVLLINYVWFFYLRPKQQI